MNTETYIAAASAFGALISALYAIRSTRIAKRALKLAEREYQSKLSALDLYLIEGVAYKDNDGKRIYAFNLSITNPATLANSLKRLELQITYVRADDSLGSVLLQHNSKLASRILSATLTPFTIPADIDAKSASSQWGLFETDDSINQFGRVEKFTVKIQDISHNYAEVDSYLIKEYDCA